MIINRKTFMFVSGIVLLTACSGNNISPVDNEPSESEIDNGIENQESSSSEEAKTNEPNQEENGSSEAEENGEQQEMQTNQQTSESDEHLTAEDIIENAIDAEAQLQSYSLEWQTHDVTSDGTVLEARDFELIWVDKNEDGPDFFYRHATGQVEDNEEDLETVFEIQTPESRMLYLENEQTVNVLTPDDDAAPMIARYSLHELLAEQSGFDLTYEGIFEVDGYRAHHIHAEGENSVMNLWFDTEMGVQVRHNIFSEGQNGTVFRLTMFDKNVELNEADFQLELPADISIIDER